MTLLKRIIPCLDVDKGRVVKGVQYVDHVDAGDPVEVAMRYDEQEADEITFLDITASHEERGILLEVVARTAESVFMPLTVGGGVRSLQDIRDLLNAGADKVSIMTAAIENPDLVAESAAKIGSANLVVAIDAKQVSAEGEPRRWEVFTHGGRKATGIDAVTEYLAEGGAPDPDEEFRTSWGFPLGQWFRYVREIRASGHLDPKDLAEIEAIPGWRW